jgi:hypothetical protein
MTFQHCVRVVSPVILALLIASSKTLAQESVAKPSPPAPSAKEIALTLTPREAPTPVLRYRLLPTFTELTPGDAAPIYLRLGYEQPDGALREADEKAKAWLLLPAAELPAAEARKLVDRWSAELRQIEYGTRRRSCDWSYTLPEESDHVLTIRLADTQAMRVWGRLLAVKARIEIAERKLEDAVRTIGTGLAFSRHVGQGGPFYINGLVGLSIANQVLAAADELIDRPESPNLYWALAALPRPLIPMRDAHENERLISERMVPELNEASRPQTPEEWSALLVRLHAQMVRLANLLWPNGPPPQAAPAAPEDFKAVMLPKARAYLKERHVEAASDDQAIVLGIVHGYRELYDEYFKRSYLPYAEAKTFDSESDKRVIAAKSGPAAVFGGMLPAVSSVQMAEARTDRKIAALRVLAALQLHAAAHGGKLPNALDEIKAVPVPNDPVTGKPFEYRRDGETATLASRAPFQALWLVYRIAVHK